MLNIILLCPEMPANVGNIMRTAVAIDAKLFLVGPTPLKLDDKALKRAGLDYIDNLNFKFYPTLDDFYMEHQEAEVVYVTRYSSINYTQYDYGRYDKPIYLMFGNESTGISLDILRKHKDHCVRIPMVANARSLNLSNAVAIVSYEVCRQQGFYSLASGEIIKGEDYL